MRVAVLAYHDVGCAALRELRRAGEDVVAVYTHRDDPNEEPWFASVAELAVEYGYPTYFPEDINSPLWVEHLRAKRPDILFSFYYRKLVCGEILAIPPRGAMNLHGSLLPHYRGRCPVNWVLIRGERRTGVTLHYMVRRADAGDIVAQREIAIDPRDTALTLHEKIVRQAAALMREILPTIRRGTHTRRAQRIESGSYFGRRRPEDGTIDWSRPAAEIHDLVRGLTRPFPGARTKLGEQTLFVWASAVDPSPAVARPAGTIDLADGVRIHTGRGALRVLECQLDDGPLLSGERMVERLRALGTGARVLDGASITSAGVR
jgi:UDP-4-amino-4-deoxy-L-arabinose formyltransferase/UDP-glucuronic acid dehydrogenase (UDP-4-keto-hexauronic acid decarboxylating)